MKKIVTSLLVGAAVMGMGTAHAKNITQQQAREAAAIYMEWRGYQHWASPSEMMLVHQDENTALGVPAAYYFNLPGEGWIIMAGTSVINPVIGYSHTGRLDMDRLPDNMRMWVDAYVDMVRDLQQADAERDFPDNDVWKELSGSKPGGGAKSVDRYLMQANWGQGDWSNPTYNLFCPVRPDSNTERGIDSTCIVGCVATATSMICHYYQYPVQPHGQRNYTWRKTGQLLTIKFDTISFDYSLMPNRLRNTTPEDQIRAVASLCRAVGYAVKMNYGGVASGTQSTEVPDAMNKYFGYNLGRLRYRSADADTGFVLSIRRELLKKNIVYMGGASSLDGGRDASGHAWLCAGYHEDDEDYYFMNWGWEAGGNGFFNLAANNMKINGYGYNFNLRTEAILGMTPPDDSNRFVVGIRDVAMGENQLGYAYPNPASLSVRLPYTTSQPADLNVYSIDGKLVSTRRVQAGQGEVELCVDAMPSGIYVYRMGAATGKFIVK